MIYLLSFLLLVFLPIHMTLGDSCPPGFTPSSLNGKCFQAVSSATSHAEAAGYCQAYGGHLVSIHTAPDNNAFVNMTQSPAWIGLKCNMSRNPASCYWDDQSGSAQVFNRFRAAQPNVTIGECVYLAPSGDWISGNCDTVKISAFICEVPLVSNSCELQLNGYCYFPKRQLLTAPDAQKECEKECANLVSIHSPDENVFILNHTRSSSPPPYFLRIGAVTNSQGPRWLDGSDWDYTNIGDDSPNFGNCWHMELTDEEVPAGEWMTSECSKQMEFMCKRRVDEQCATSPPPSTMAPNQCGANATILHNNGTFSSPNYPNTYIGEQLPCKYLMDTPQGTLAQIRFPTLDLDPQAYIRLTGDPYGNYPLPPVTTANQWYNSTTNIIYMVFQPCTSTACLNYQHVFKWAAEFRPQPPVVTPTPPVVVTMDPRNPSGCNSSIPTTVGYFTSPNYPQNYPNSIQCSYTLTTTPGNRILLTFDDLELYPDHYDEVVVRDGTDISPYNIIYPVLKGTLPRVDPYRSTNHTMLVVFLTDSQDNSKGFHATFQSF